MRARDEFDESFSRRLGKRVSKLQQRLNGISLRARVRARRARERGDAPRTLHASGVAFTRGTKLEHVTRRVRPSARAARGDRDERSAIGAERSDAARRRRRASEAELVHGLAPRAPLPPPPPKFLGDFRADASDTDEDTLEAGSSGDDARRGRRASSSETTHERRSRETRETAVPVSRGLIAAVTAKTKARAEARAVAEARAEAARRITEAAERAEEDKKKRNRSLVENFRRASRAAAAAATTLKSERKSERAVARDRRAEITQLWAAELAFEAEADMRRETRDARSAKARLTLANRTRGESARVRRESDRESDERETRRDENEAFRCDETRFVTTDERTETPAPTLAEARLHAAYARREMRAYGARCAGRATRGRVARHGGVRRPLGGAQKHDVRGAARSTPAGIYRR